MRIVSGEVVLLCSARTAAHCSHPEGPSTGFINLDAWVLGKQKLTVVQVLGKYIWGTWTLTVVIEWHKMRTSSASEGPGR